jgi:hypothetical protein
MLPAGSTTNTRRGPLAALGRSGRRSSTPLVVGGDGIKNGPAAFLSTSRAAGLASSISAGAAELTFPKRRVILTRDGAPLRY